VGASTASPPAPPTPLATLASAFQGLGSQACSGASSLPPLDTANRPAWWSALKLISCAAAGGG
jgi:hypothetical protein